MKRHNVPWYITMLLGVAISMLLLYFMRDSNGDVVLGEVLLVMLSVATPYVIGCKYGKEKYGQAVQLSEVVKDDEVVMLVSLPDRDDIRSSEMRVVIETCKIRFFVIANIRGHIGEHYLYYVKGNTLTNAVGVH